MNIKYTIGITDEIAYIEDSDNTMIYSINVKIFDGWNKALERRFNELMNIEFLKQRFPKRKSE